MAPRIIENYTDCGVKIGKIVKRIVKYAPSDSVEGVNEILILDKDPTDKGFARYDRNEAKIELYVDDIIRWQPWLFRKSYIFPYIAIGLALGHELDHHVNKEKYQNNKEKSAETNALKYIYPSLGIFKPIAKLLSFLFRRKDF